MFIVVDNILLIIWFFIYRFYCYCPLRNSSLLSNCIGPLLLNRLLCSSMVGFYNFVLVVLSVSFSWLCCGLVVQVSLGF